MQAWYERRWKDAQDITPEVLRIIERHTREYTPFEVYVKALQEFCRGHELTAGEWELAGPDYGGSYMYPMLDRYQQEGYQALMQVARRFSAAQTRKDMGERHRSTWQCRTTLSRNSYPPTRKSAI